MPHPLLESFPFLQSQTITLRNNRHNVDNLAQLLHHQDIDRLEGVTGRSNEVEAAVNSSIDNMLVSHRCQFFSEVGGMLIFDVLDYGIPAIAFETDVSELVTIKRDRR